jgi:hypothetical protein
MAKKTKPQIASVEQPFGIDPPIVHCPICGNATITIDKVTGGEVTPCDHLAFIHVPEAGGFIYKSSDFDQRITKIEESDEDDGWDDFGDLLIKAGYQNNMLAIEITYGGMCHCPVYYTDIVGFDYAMISQD